MTHSTHPAIEFIDVHKIYQQGDREVRALDGVSLRINHGEFVSIMGPSGSGKSTALHLAGGLDLPTSGKLLIDGQNTVDLDDRSLTLLRRKKIGFVFQFFNLLPTLTMVENVALPAMIGGQTGASVRSRAIELLERMGLGDRLDHLPEQLSGGQMQRVAIARALINDPPILLTDEPTGNLDSQTGEEILTLFQEIARERTVISVTHDPRAAAFGTRTIQIIDGRIREADSNPAADEQPVASTEPGAAE